MAVEFANNAVTLRAQPEMAEVREHASEAAAFLKALANDQRLLVLCALLDGALSVGEINERVPLSQSALSQHLGVLRDAGLVVTKRQSQTIYYEMAQGPALRVMEVLYSSFCRPAGPRRRPKSRKAGSATAAGALAIRDSDRGQRQALERTQDCSRGFWAMGDDITLAPPARPRRWYLDDAPVAQPVRDSQARQTGQSEVRGCGVLDRFRAAELYLARIGMQIRQQRHVGCLARARSLLAHQPDRCAQPFRRYDGRGAARACADDQVVTRRRDDDQLILHPGPDEQRGFGARPLDQPDIEFEGGDSAADLRGIADRDRGPPTWRPPGAIGEKSCEQ